MPAANQRISEYVLEEVLGSGTFGQVWRAHHHVWTNHLVAVKLPSDPQYIRNLQREGIASRALVHPNIVRAIGFDPYASPPYLVMEYIPGASLRPLIEHRTLRPEDAVAVLRQVLAALAYAHGQGVVHRDIKPENILIHERAGQEGYGVEGVVKVTDFGLGRVAGNTAESIAYSTSLAGPEARRIAGTLDYMAPEQRNGAEVDGRADLYACGVVLYEMLTGEKPAGTDPPSELNPAVPKPLDQVFRRSYARLDRRYGSAEEFLADLDRLSGNRAGRAAGKACPRCHQPVEAGDQFCIGCGAQLVARVRRCPRCGAYPDASDQFCIFCGERLAGLQARAGADVRR